MKLEGPLKKLFILLIIGLAASGSNGLAAPTATFTAAVTVYPFPTLTPGGCCPTGTTWTQATASAFPARTVFGSTVFATQDGVNHMWVMAGTENATTTVADVWRSENGADWTEVTAAAAFGPRESFPILNYNGFMWIIGGGRGAAGPSTYLNDVWKSSDGLNWTEVTANAAFSARVLHSAVVYNGAMWVIGGYSAGVLADVWTSTDGANWTEVTAAAAFGARQAQASQVFNGKMWVIGGNNIGANFNDAWYSTDGATWTEATANAAFQPRWGSGLAVNCGQLWLLSGAGTGVQYNDVWTSSDGINWAEQASSYEAAGVDNFGALAFNNTVWSIGGDSSSGTEPWVYNAVCITPSPTATASPTVTPIFTETQTFTASPTITASPTFTPTPPYSSPTVTPTRNFAVSSLGKAQWGVVPVVVGKPLILYYDKAPTSSSCQIYDVGGEKVVDASFPGPAASLQTGQFAPGVYIIRTTVNYDDGGTQTFVQNIVVIR